MFSLLRTAVILSSRKSLLLAVALGLPVAAFAQAPTIASFTPIIGASGTVVTITGTNLLSTTSVLINGQAMPIATSPGKTATTVTVTIPNAASSGKLRLTTPTGSVLSGSRFLVRRASSSTTTTQIGTGTVSTIDIGAYSTPTTTDLDADGLVDLLVGTDAGTIVRYEQIAVGQPGYPGFTTPGTTLTANTVGAPATFGTLDVGNFAKPTVTDLDGDGLLDLLVGEGTGTVLRYEQTAAGATSFNALGAITTATTVASGTGLGQYVKPTIADIDGDGLLDMLVGGESGRILRYEQTAVNSGTFTLIGNLTTNGTTMIDSGVTANGVSKPLLVDYDGDGLLDLLIGNVDGYVERYEQIAVNSDRFALIGNLSNGTTDLDAGTYAAPAMADLDGDGLLDLLLGNADGTILRYEQGAATPSPLPVVLVSFTARAAANGCQLNWATAQEVKSASFVVEASADGVAFAEIAQLAAAGNSSTLISYVYADNSAAAKTAKVRYYRLRQVDTDGTTTFSPVATVIRETAAATVATAFPNPFAETLAVALPAALEPQQATVVLSTLAGQQVYRAQLQLGAAPQELPALSALPAGVYVLRLTTATGASTLKVTRQ